MYEETLDNIENLNNNSSKMYCLHCHSVDDKCKSLKQCQSNMVTLKEAEGRLKCHIQLTKSQLDLQHRNLTQLKFHLDEFNRSYLKCKEDIKYMANEIVSKIREHEGRLLQELDSYQDIEYRKCECSSTDVDKRETDLHTLFDLCDKLLDLESVNFLEQFRKDREKFNILKLDVCSVKTPELKPKTIQFVPVKCNTSFATLNISDVHVERPFNLSNSGRRQSLKIESNIMMPVPRSVSLKGQAGQRKLSTVGERPGLRTPTRKLSLQIPMLNDHFSPIMETLTGKQPRSSTSSSNGILELDDLSSSCESIEEDVVEELWRIDTEGPNRGEISCPSDVTFLPEKNLVVSDRGNMRLQVFDTEGNLVTVIGEKKIKPFRVSTTAGGKIVVTDTKDNCVRLFNKKGHSITTLGKKLFKSGISFKELGAVGATNDQYIISDLATNEVTVHGSDGKQLRHFDMEFKKPFYISVNNDRILISDNLDHSVKVFDMCGNFLFQCVLPTDDESPSGSPDQMSTTTNYLQYPSGVCGDDVGNIYVADWGSHTVSLFDSTGTFIKHLVTKEHGLYQPAGVAVSGDYLAVSSYSESQSCVVMYRLGKL